MMVMTICPVLHQGGPSSTSTALSEGRRIANGVRSWVYAESTTQIPRKRRRLLFLSRRKLAVPLVPLAIALND